MSKIALLILLSFVMIISAKDTNMIVYTGQDKLIIKVSLANFGFFKYGHKLTGRIQIGANFTYWGEGVDQDRHELRSDGQYESKQKQINFDVFKNDTYGCKHYQQFNEKYISSYGQPIYIVDRGTCTFVKKASNAAKYGKMLIIVDNSDETDVDKITMGDDLSGAKVMIPVVMVSKEDGTLIKEFLNKELESRDNDQSNQVWMSISFNKPHENKESEIQYWMIPSEKNSYSFLSNHTQFIQSLVDQKKITFQPHFVFFRCEGACLKNYEGKQDKLDNFCIQNGLYCHPDPDNKGPLTGVDSIKQTLAEMCIYDKFPQYFLTYLFGFHECFAVKNNPYLSCDKEAQQFVLDKYPEAKGKSFQSKIQECTLSELTPKRGKSVLLEKEYQLFVEQGLKFYPALFVNGDIYRGDLLIKEGAEEFICEGFEDTTDIPECDPYREIKDDEDKFSTTFVSASDSHVILIVCIVLLIAFLIGIFIYRRKVKLEVQKELTVQVDAAIQQYYALNDHK